MGYDIYCRGSHPEVDEARGIAYALPRDSDERRTAFDTLWGLERSSGSYFRVNIFGMGPLRTAMAECGGLDETDHPKWPDPWPETSDESEVHPDVLAVLEYEGETPFIPAPKLGSNDGWIITEKQAKASFEACDQFDAREVVEKDMRPLWKEWLHFLDHVSSHGGASVH